MIERNRILRRSILGGAIALAALVALPAGKVSDDDVRAGCIGWQTADDYKRLAEVIDFAHPKAGAHRRKWEACRDDWRCLSNGKEVWRVFCARYWTGRQSEESNDDD